MGLLAAVFTYCVMALKAVSSGEEGTGPRCRC